MKVAYKVYNEEEVVRKVQALLELGSKDITIAYVEQPRANPPDSIIISFLPNKPPFTVTGQVPSNE